MQIASMLTAPGDAKPSMGRVSGFALIAIGILGQFSDWAMNWLIAFGKIKCALPDSGLPAWAWIATMALGGVLYLVTKFKAGPVEMDMGGDRT